MWSVSATAKSRRYLGIVRAAFDLCFTVPNENCWTSSAEQVTANEKSNDMLPIGSNDLVDGSRTETQSRFDCASEFLRVVSGVPPGERSTEYRSGGRYGSRHSEKC